METNSPQSPPTSMLSGIPLLPPSQPSLTTINHGMVSSSIQKSPILHADGKSLESSFSTSATVLRTGPWSVTGYPFSNLSDSCPHHHQEEFIGKEIARIHEICGSKGRVIGAVSGGVDSTVAAKLMHEAIGDR